MAVTQTVEYLSEKQKVARSNRAGHTRRSTGNYPTKDRSQRAANPREGNLPRCKGL